MSNQIVKTVILFFCIVILNTVQARTLPQILQEALKNNPKLSEALANERIAGTRLEQTASSRWPVVAATGGQRVLSSNSNGSGFEPALKGTWTIYDFGKNNAQIDSDLLKIDYYTNKTQETAEELIYEIAGYYLEALKSKLSLLVAKDNLKRHHEIVKMLNVIVKYDPGRRSELTQAKSRLLQVESDITNYQRALGLALLRISPYVKPAVTADELRDPFESMSAKALVSRYRVIEKSLQSHPSYLAQQKEMMRIAADLVVAEKAKWPNVDLVGVASRNESSVYLNVDMDLFNRKLAPGVDEKRYEIQAAQAQLEQIERNLNERAKLAELKMLQDQTRLYIAESQIKELKQIAMDYEDQFSIAKRSLLDVVNSYRELSGIELFKVETEYDLMVAKLDYLSAIGALRDWARVTNNNPHPLLLNADALPALPEAPAMASTEALPAKLTDAENLSLQSKQKKTTVPTSKVAALGGAKKSGASKADAQKADTVKTDAKLSKAQAKKTETSVKNTPQIAPNQTPVDLGALENELKSITENSPITLESLVDEHMAVEIQEKNQKAKTTGNQARNQTSAKSATAGKASRSSVDTDEMAVTIKEKPSDIASQKVTQAVDVMNEELRLESLLESDASLADITLEAVPESSPRKTQASQTSKTNQREALPAPVADKPELPAQQDAPKQAKATLSAQDALKQAILSGDENDGRLNVRQSGADTQAMSANASNKASTSTQPSKPNRKRDVSNASDSVNKANNATILEAIDKASEQTNNKASRPRAVSPPPAEPIELLIDDMSVATKTVASPQEKVAIQKAHQAIAKATVADELLLLSIDETGSDDIVLEIGDAPANEATRQATVPDIQLESTQDEPLLLNLESLNQ